MAYYRRTRLSDDYLLKAYIIGVALGDGNLSNPNGRAIRLRISCDKKYPELLAHIATSLQALLPENRVLRTERRGCFDIYVYSNHLSDLIGYHWNGGPKNLQDVGVPNWIRKDRLATRECLRGLFQTDGSIYTDRKYMMVNFTNTGERLVRHTIEMVEKLGYSPTLFILDKVGAKRKYTIRIAKQAEAFIKDINLWKR